MIHKTTPKPSIRKENNQGQRSGGRSLRERSKPSTQIGSFQPQQNSAQLYKQWGFFCPSMPIKSMDIKSLKVSTVGGNNAK